MGMFSFYDPSINSVLPVGTTQVVVSQARPQNAPNKRKVILVRNNSPNSTDIITIQMTDSQVATANAGIILRQYESFTDASDNGYECWQGQISAICATATGSLSILER